MPRAPDPPRGGDLYSLAGAAGDEKLHGSENMTHQEQDAAHRAQEFIADGRQRIDGMVDAQARFWDRVQDSNRKWLDRLQNEATLTADLANRLTAAKSLTETAGIVQNWTVKHMEMAAEDARRILTDTQEIFAASARFWTEGDRNGNGADRGH
jgi:DNA replication initiation complex subunit (GINS family)